MGWLTKVSLKNGVAVAILTILVLIGGMVAANQIQLETYPDVSMPAVAVTVQYPGASATDVEEGVTIPIEDALGNLKGVEEMTSTSAENRATLFLTYEYDKDIDEANTEVEETLATVSLPESAEAEVLELSPNSMPVIRMALASDDEASLQHLLETTIVPELEQTTGVQSVTLDGGKSRELIVEVDPEKAQSYELDLQTIRSAIESQTYAYPLGSIEQDGMSIPVRMTGELNNIDELKAVTIANEPPANPQTGEASREPNPSTPSNQTTPVTLDDVATIKEGSEQREITRLNGQEAFLIQVTKEQDANTADVSNQVKTILESHQEKERFSLYTVSDEGAEVEQSVSTLTKEALFGALFTVIVIAIFLRNWRATVIAICSLPVSIFATISLLDGMGYTLNIMTLGGLAVSIGRIVDDSIVVIENIYRWKQERLEPNGFRSVYRATREVTSAIASSTIATVVVFLPLGLVSGMIGEMFRPFAFAVVISILVSLLVAVMLIPVLGNRFFRKVPHQTRESWLSRQYERVLRGSLRRKGWILALSGILLIGSLGLIPTLGVSFIPSGDEPAVEATVTLPASSKREVTDRIAQDVEDQLRQRTDVETVQTSIGNNDDSFQTLIGSEQRGDHVAQFYIRLKENTPMDPTLKELEQDINDWVQQEEPEATVSVMEGQQEGPPSGSHVDVRLYGENVEDLNQVAAEVEKLLQANDSVKNVTNQMEDVRSQWVITLNEDGKEQGLNPQQVMRAVQEQLQPLSMDSMELDGEEWNVSIQYPDTPSTQKELESITIKAPSGEQKLGDVATLEPVEEPVEIQHLDGRTYAKVSADLIGNNTAQATQAIQAEVTALSLPESVEVEIGGGMEMITEGFTDLGWAMVVAAGLVFLVLSMTFGGIITPLVILSSLFFVPIGSLGALLLTGQTLSMSAMIGMLMLIGIVTTNAVVLLDRVEKNRRAGMDVTEALVEAGKVRLRPILMTALATIFALVPLALSGASATLVSKGLAITVIGGLTTSTLLTLLVVPVLYHLMKRRSTVKKIDI
jgi:multidrug efflux pump subunit AcrB